MIRLPRSLQIRIEVAATSCGQLAGQQTYQGKLQPLSGFEGLEKLLSRMLKRRADRVDGRNGQAHLA